MKRLLAPFLLFLATVLTAPAAAPTFGQVMWTNDGVKVLLSPERSTNRVQLPTNLVTFGGVSAAFPAMFREGTTLNFRLADQSGFAPIAAGPITSRINGMFLDTEDSATPFAHSFFFRKKGGTGGTNDPISADTELGPLQWRGWTGAAYETGAAFIPMSEQPWVAGVSTGTRIEVRLVSSNLSSGTLHSQFVFPGNSTNAMITFNGITASQPALKRFGRFLQVRSADNSGFADLAVSNININGVTYFWTGIEATVPSIATNNGTAGANAVGWWPISAMGGGGSSVFTNTSGLITALPTYLAFRVGMTNDATLWASTNLGVGSIGFGTNVVAGGLFSSVLGGAHNRIPTNDIYSVIGGGISNVMVAGSAVNVIGGGMQNVIEGGAGSTNNVIAGGRQNTNAASSANNFMGSGWENYMTGNQNVIAGGSRNLILTAGDNNVIAGGDRNRMFNGPSTGSFIGAGAFNTNWGATYCLIGSGFGNRCVNSLYSVIGGGAFNSIESSSYQFIGGGQGNFIPNSPVSFIVAGTSNTVENGVSLASVMGNWGTNKTDKSVLISPAGTHGSNQLHVTATATTNLGPLKVQMGRATTAYAGVGGVLWSTNFPIFNAGVAETNLVSVTIPAHTLSNLNSSLIIEASGSMAAATVGTNQIRLLFGSQVLMDTGLQTASNGWYRIRATISSSSLTAGFTNQFTTADHFWWGVGLTGMPFRDTNFNNWTTQTNGINTTLSLATTSRRNGGITNESFRVRWVPNSP